MKYVIYGLGISGTSLIKFLAQNNEEVIATDDNEKSILEAKSKLNLSNVLFLKPDEIKYDENTLISFAPGIPLYFPKRHNILEIVKKTKAQLLSDIEIFYRKNSHNNFIAITGTNGKSTTTALSGFILKELEIDAQIGGNIGKPCFDLEMGQNKTFVFETSSYQLDLLSQAHFHIAALLNITPDHIDRHGSLEEYIKAKKRIFQNQNANDFALIDVDNKNSYEVFKELKNDENFKAKLIPISTIKIQENGLALIGGILHNKINNCDSKLELASKFLKGKHNDQNMAFAFAYCCGNFPENKIIEKIKLFQGLRHRLQFVAEIDGIKFINDSKATNAESSENALKAYDNIFWILGGKSKEGGISSLEPYFNKVIKAYLIGEASEEFAKTLEKNSINFEKCHDLENAFKKALFDAKTNSLSQKNILLSPACASFDQWKNFEERGDYFCKLINELKNSQKD
jgi:UDP-N-acetylmuramoylalanine--D-glutamate ligase